MTNEEIRVRDLYEGAYLLCRGFQLKDLTVLGRNGRKVVTFVIAGDGVEPASEEYRAGRATANVALLKFTMEKLKDRMFTRIREDGGMEQGERSMAGRR